MSYIIRLLCRCAAVPAHEAYIAHTAHPVLRTHIGFKKGIRAVSCPYPTPISVKAAYSVTMNIFRKIFSF